MSNDNKELKNEGINKLTEEELEQVTGGLAHPIITHDVAPDILELEASL